MQVPFPPLGPRLALEGLVAQWISHHKPVAAELNQGQLGHAVCTGMLLDSLLLRGEVQWMAARDVFGHE